MAVTLTIVIGLAVAIAGTAAARSLPRQQAVPGFDGKTIKVSGLVSASNFFDSPIGAEARIKAANDCQELGKGI